MKIVLTPDLKRLVTEKVESGQYQSASDVICEALWLLKDQDDLRQHKLEELRREIAIGIEQADRGEVAPLDIEAIKAEGHRRLAEVRRDIQVGLDQLDRGEYTVYDENSLEQMREDAKAKRRMPPRPDRAVS